MHVGGAVDGLSVWEVCRSCRHAVSGASAVSEAQVAGSPAQHWSIIRYFAVLLKLQDSCGRQYFGAGSLVQCPLQGGCGAPL